MAFIIFMELMMEQKLEYFFVSVFRVLTLNWG